ncbi:sensor histidine kinase [Streptomyces boluensis]|uniref:histidine kinase n=1 Tax=Streptomyces boluensis TaxID=1775135 RepID=A0A964UYC2_9ACTN|nr:sensor histidine kinase [Streptomyces boluensis]NBE56495.1 two-component sensor histidine kinase [Streptomyces boluensis]
MTQTKTQTQSTSPPRTEASLIRATLQAFRSDLFTGAFAFRPLEPLVVEGDGASRLLRVIPKSRRRSARWLPHVGVGLVAVIVFLGGAWMPAQEFTEGVLIGLVALAPVLMTLFRPVAALWLSFAVTVLTVPLTRDMIFPWTVPGLLAHLFVIVFVTSRSRPRVALELWVLTFAFSVAFGLLIGESGPTLVTAVASGLFLAVAASVRGWSSARHEVHAKEREVVAKEEVTLVERSRRTLLEERTTIARELHDVVAHHMSVVAIQAEAAPYRVENPPPELTQAFATIRENAVAALTELRRVLGVVRSADYEAPDAPQPTLGDLDALVANVREAGLTVGLTVTGAVRELPSGVELSAYRIVQEALSNALRHAPGATADVEVSYVLGGLGLRIVNGPATGLQKPTPGTGHGLTGMRERVAMLDGEMTTGPAADGGYEVTVFLPARGSDEERSV